MWQSYANWELRSINMTRWAERATQLFQDLKFFELSSLSEAC